jgi:hypothetical protein
VAGLVEQQEKDKLRSDIIEQGLAFFSIILLVFIAT